MSQSGYTPIQLYRTTTAAATPTAGNLAAGELAINLTDEKLYFKNAGGTVKLLASTDTLGTVTSVAASGGTTGLTFSGSPITTSGTLTLGGTLGVANGGTGTTTAFTAGSVVFAGASGVYSQDNANLFWDNANDRLGIGTATPSFKLDVAGTLRSTGVATLGTGATTTIATIGDDSTTNTRIIQFTRAASVTDIVNIQGVNAGIGAANISMQLSGGNVGIGTATPSEKLSIVSTDVYQFSFKNASASSLGAIGYNSTDNMLFYANGSERMRIDTSGNVGIGDSSPAYKLTVAGDLRLTGGGDLRISSATGTTTFGGDSQIYNDANNMIFGTGTTTAERMRLDSSGQLGIGTSSPGYRLDVAAADTTAGLGYAVRLRSNATAAAAAIQFTDSPVNAQNGLIACTDTGILTLQGGDGGSAAVAFRTGGDERFKINNTGGITSSALADAVGYKGLPQNSQTSSYTLALTDIGKHISITTGGVVIPANGSVAFPIGATIVVFNNSGSTQTISITTDTLRQAGTTNTGSRTLAVYGLATLVKVTSTVWAVTGNIS